MNITNEGNITVLQENEKISSLCRNDYFSGDNTVSNKISFTNIFQHVQPFKFPTQSSPPQ